MANIALLTLNVDYPVPGRVKDALIAAGHSVTQIAQGSYANANSASYDLIAMFRCTLNSSQVATVRGYGKPIVCGVRHGLAEGLRIFSGRTDTSGINPSLVCAEHSANGGLAGDTVTARGTNDYISYLNGTSVGTTIQTATISGSSRVVGAALAAGANDLDASAVPANLVVLGWCYPEAADLTADGKTLLAAAVQWALAGDPPEIPIAPTVQSVTSIANGTATFQASPYYAQGAHVSTHWLVKDAITGTTLYDEEISTGDLTAHTPPEDTFDEGLTLEVSAAYENANGTSDYGPTRLFASTSLAIAQISIGAHNQQSVPAAALEEIGHDVTLISDATVAGWITGNTLAANLGGYDLIFFVRSQLSSANKALVRALGIPIICDAKNHGVGDNITAPRDLKVWEESTTPTSAGDSITAADHDANGDLSGSLTFRSGDTYGFLSYVSAGYSYKGDVIAEYYDPARVVATAVEAGTAGFDSVAIPARIVVLGWCSIENGFLSADGKKLLHFAAWWAVGYGVPTPQPPTAPAIAAEATDYGEITVEMTGGGEGADTIALYGADDPADLPEEGPGAGADLLDADWDGTAHVETGLGYSKYRAYRAYATNDAGTTASNRPSATTAALPTPSVAAEADTPYQFTATITPAETATDHELYVGLSPTGLFVAGNLYADELGATPSPVAVTDRGENLVYYVGVRALFAGGLTSDSAIVSVAMPDDPDPALQATAVTDEGATFRLINVAPADADESQWEVAARADSTYATPLWQSGTITEDGEETGRLLQQWYEGAATTQYRTHARYRKTGDPWPETWLEVLWETAPVPEQLPFQSGWQTPSYGQPISGTYCAHLDVEAGFTLVEVLASTDGGTTWAAVPSGAISDRATADEYYRYVQFCFDTTDFSQGAFVRLRAALTYEDGTIYVTHHGFRIDNENEVVSGRLGDFDLANYNDYAEGSCYVHKWTDPVVEARNHECAPCQYVQPGGGDQLGASMAGHAWREIGYSPSFGPVSEDAPWLQSNKGMDVSVQMFLNCLGGGHRWEWMIPGENVSIGVGIASPLTPDGGLPPIRAWFETWIMTTAYPTGCVNPGYERMGVSRGMAHLQIGTAHFTRAIDTWAGPPSMEWQALCPDLRHDCPPGSGNFITWQYCWHRFQRASVRSLNLRLQAYRPDPINYPRRWYVAANFIGGYIPSQTNEDRGYALVTNSFVGEVGGTNEALIAEVVDLDYDIDCGALAFFDEIGPNPGYSESSARMFGEFSARVLDYPEECGGEPPPPPEPPYLEPMQVTAEGDCGDLTVTAGWPVLPAQELASAELVIRNAVTLETVYTAPLQVSTEWTFIHGVHTLPYYTPLEAQARWTDADGAVSEWSDWEQFEINYVWEDCVTAPTTGVRRILFGEPGDTSVGLDITESAKRRIIFGEVL